ncbi:nucleotidyltransferase domain-containing protein, partial [Streptococcus ruminantium]
MSKFDITKIRDIIKSKHIEIICLILHGSRTLDVQNKESDIDIVAVTETGQSEDIVEIIDGEKYHIIFREKEYLEGLSEDFFNIILNRIFDYNSLSGRIMSGDILWEKKGSEISSLIARNIIELDKSILDRKLHYQMISQLKDATTNSRYINLICIQNAVDTLICRFLLKKNIFFLNQKWFPYYVERYFEKEISKYYYNLRFSQT